MSRYFRPVGGFPANSTQTAVRIDDDDSSHAIFADGTDKPLGSRDEKTARWIPTWSIGEMENLVRGRQWEEFAPEPPKPAAPIANKPSKPTADPVTKPIANAMDSDKH